MSQVVIENPILNSPFVEPTRHFKFGDDGITDEIAQGRRESSYFIPIPRAKKQEDCREGDNHYGDEVLKVYSV